MSDYNLGLVALSYLLSVLGSYTALKLAAGMIHAEAKQRWPWMIGAAFALGGTGIWAMHFVGMLALNTPLDFGYDPLLTFASLILAVAVIAVGLFVVAIKPQSLAALLLAGTITGLGVATMHYTGMAAMIMPGSMTHATPLVIVSVLIAVGAAICALWLALHVSDTRLRVVSALIMGVAVCGMHYTGMAAMKLDFGLPQQLTLSDLQYQSAIGADTMAILIAVVAVASSIALWLGTYSQFRKLERDKALMVN